MIMVYVFIAALVLVAVYAMGFVRGLKAGGAWRLE